MRYTGPKWKINRREGFTVLGTTEKWKGRSGLPGQFPVLKKRPSEYSIQLREKQKVKRIYGMTEKQFKNFYEKAVKSEGNTSLKLLQLLELRLDNVLYRLGFAVTRSQARQFVSHGLVKLNGKKHNIPSTVLKVGDEVELKDSILNSIQMTEIKNFLKAQTILPWLRQTAKGGVIIDLPAREHMDQSINERLIVELYSR